MEVRPRVGIALPLVALKAKPLVSLTSTLCSTDAQMALLVTEGAYIPYNRMLLVGLAREQECTHIFFVDHDVVYGSDTLTKLLAHDKDIVAAPYNMKTYPPQTTVFVYDENNERVPLERLPKELFRAHAAATGCMLIKMSVFDKIEKPWFAIQIDKETDTLTISEDVWFCNQARKAGFDVWVDPTIPIGHIGEAVF